jgi:predicted enzyme related to lactoylglutathione lyase
MERSPQVAYHAVHLFDEERGSVKVNSFNINLTSDDPRRLIEFYRDVVQLPLNEQMGEGAFDVGGAALLIDGHSEVSGRAKEPARVLINFFVDDLAAEQQRLEQRGVQFIRTAGREYWGGVISTFLDPDGNYLQLIEFRPD